MKRLYYVLMVASLLVGGNAFAESTVDDAVMAEEAERLRQEQLKAEYEAEMARQFQAEMDALQAEEDAAMAAEAASAESTIPE